MNTSPASTIPDSLADQPPAVELAVIVLNYRTPGMVIDCLESLEGQIQAPAQQVVVVDNNSSDDSAAQIQGAIRDRGWGAWVRFVQSPVNGGFAAGNNVGIRSIDSQVYLLLNSDTLVQDGAIATLMKTMDEHPEIHMLGPRLEWPNGDHQISTFRYRTPVSELIYASSLGVIGRIFPNHVVARELHHWTTGINWMSFACIAIRKDVIDAVGGLDESYFMYFEDMAFCRKATRSGFMIAYQPDAHVVHLRGGSSPVKEATRQRKRPPMYYLNARSQYLHTFYGTTGFVLANVLWTLGWCLGALRGRTGAVAHEWRDIWASPKHSMGNPS